MLPQVSAYVKSYDGETKWMYFFIKYRDKKLVKNIMKSEIKSAMYQKRFDSESVFNEKYIKIKITSYGDEVKDFHDKKCLKKESNYIYGNYYPQMFLKECKYIEKEKMVIRYITNDLKISFDDSDRE